jgi:hypothetical protein
LETIARDSPSGIRFDPDQKEALRRLGVSEFHRRLVDRFKSEQSSPQLKSLFLDIADAIRAHELVEPALHFILDFSQDEDTREKALFFVCKLAANDQLRRLEVPIGEIAKDEERDGNLRARLILELMNREVWSARRAAINAPAAQRFHLDHRAYLLHRIEEELTVDESRALIPHFQELLARHQDSDHAELPGFMVKALSLVVEQSILPPGDVDLLTDMVIAWLPDKVRLCKEAIDVGYRLRGNMEARRKLYSWEAERVLRGEEETIARRFLMPEDWAWLREKALSTWSDLSYIWSDVYLLARGWQEQQQLSDSDWNGILSDIEVRSPGLLKTITEGERQSEEQRLRLEERRRKTEESRPKPRGLTELVEEALSKEDIDPAQRAGQLGFLAQAHSILQRPDVIGEWDQLSSNLRVRASRALREGVEHGSPSPMLPGNQVSYVTFGQSAAFAMVVKASDAQDWVTGEHIIRWLPVALQGLMNQDWTSLLRLCWALERTATEQVLQETISEQLTRYGSPTNLFMVPSECWTVRLSDEVGRFLENLEIQPKARAELLFLLAIRDFERAWGFARAWAARSVEEGSEDELRRAGRNVLICREPEVVLRMLEAEIRTRKAAAIEELTVLEGDRDGLRAEYRDWPVALREQLARLLVQACHFIGEPEGFARGTDLRLLRSNLIGSLEEDTSPEAREALDRVAALDPNPKHYLLTRSASNAAQAAISQLPETVSSVEDTIPVDKVLKLLHRYNYRLIRDCDDIFDALLYAFATIKQDVKHDLPLLYGPPKRSSNNLGKKAINRSAREHLQEDALQAYVRLRLQDLLAKDVDGIQIDLLRRSKLALEDDLTSSSVLRCSNPESLPKL